MKRMLRLLLLSIIIALFPHSASADTPVVRAVLFYSPTCSHCQKVMTVDLPPLKEQYGDQLQIFEVNVREEAGSNLYQTAIETLKIPDERIGVPTLVVGTTILVGIREIPGQFPGLIESLLAQGGIDWPDLAGLQDQLAQQGLLEENTTFWQTAMQKFNLDPLANSIAVGVWIAMLISLAAVLWISQSSAETPRLLASLPTWVIPLLAVIGLGVAGYLTYVESFNVQAVCGPVGNCNAVQSSPYALVFGILPIGYLGLAGYAAILLAWLVQQNSEARLKRWCGLAIWGMAVFGVLFSIYLTFLEPFVIGATCAWCVTSAVVMTLTLWAAIPAGKDALAMNETEDGEDADEEEE